MNLNYPNLSYPFGVSEELFPEEAAAERAQEIIRRGMPHHASGIKGDWHYRASGRRAWGTWMAVAFSAGFHATILFGLNHRMHPKPVQASTAMEVGLVEMPEKLKELEDLADPGENSAELAAGVDAPTLPDIPPTVVLEGAFIQQMDISSLTPKLNLENAKVSVIPPLVRHGGQGGASDKMKGIFDLSSLDRAPTPIFQALPVVPMNLRGYSTSLNVRVAFIVTSKGDVVEPYVVESDAPEFNDIAIRGVMKWKFKPGMKGGKAVGTRIQQPITFNFTD